MVFWCVLFQPAQDGQVTAVEEFAVVVWEVALASAYAPFVATFVRFHFTHQNLEQCGGSNFIVANKCNFFTFFYTEGYIVQYFYAVNGFAQAFYCQNFFTGFTVHFKAQVWVFTRGYRQFFYSQFIQQFTTGSSLFCLGFISREARDKTLQFFDFVFFFTVLVTHQSLHQLAGFIPEVIVPGVDFDLFEVDIYDVGAYHI